MIKTKKLIEKVTPTPTKLVWECVQILARRAGVHPPPPVPMWAKR